MSSIKPFLRSNKLNLAILLFLAVFTIIHLTKPGLFYLPDGSFREFGVGYRNKTVVPIWIAAILIAIFSYIAVLWYLVY
jgi:hypothetical protein